MAEETEEKSAPVPLVSSKFPGIALGPLLTKTS
jgi:hypothetical protein